MVRQVNFTNPYNYSAWSSVYDPRSFYFPDYSEPVRTAPKEDNPVKTLGLAALLQGVAVLLNKGSSWCSYKLQQGKEFTSAENVQNIAREMVKKNNLDVSVGYVSPENKAGFVSKFGGAAEFEAVAKGQNAFFSDGLKLAVAPKSKPSLILHELGHAVNATKGKFMRFLQNSRGWAMAAPTALLVLSSMFPKKEGEKQNFIQKNAGLLGFAAYLPTIVEEGIASARGVKAARKVLGKTANLAPLKWNYLFALGTYILAGVGLGVAAKETIIKES